MNGEASIDLPLPLQRGNYTARFARTAADVAAAQRLRHLCFVETAGRAPLRGGIEADQFDAQCDHVLVEDKSSNVVGCFRLQDYATGAEIVAGYTAQFYDVAQLTRYSDPLVELGRFCVHPDATDVDILRIAWGMLTRFVDGRGAAMLFGCSSFAGTDAGRYAEAFNLLAARHLAPRVWSPGVKAPHIVPFAGRATPVADHRAARAQMPPLLKTYLSMGGWVSDHAVIDAHMNTLHVFTGLEIATIPPPRARALRSI